jgi:prepilin-type N-terminal cleavage/methylation domain-containing protein
MEKSPRILRAHRHTPRRFFSTGGGFSLIELLVVIAILSILVVTTVSGFKNISTSRGVTQAAADVVSILELARNEAVTRQTFTWVVFKDATNSGNLELQMVALGSANGSSSAAGSNLTMLSRVVKIRNCGLTDFSALSAGTRGQLSNNVTVTDLGTSGITYTNLTQDRFLDNMSVTFTPRGEAILKGQPSSSDGFVPNIGIGVIPARGTQKAQNSTDDAGIVLDGSTGIARTLRL